MNIMDAVRKEIRRIDQAQLEDVRYPIYPRQVKLFEVNGKLPPQYVVISDQPIPNCKPDPGER